MIKILSQGVKNNAATHSKDYSKAQYVNNQAEEIKALTEKAIHLKEDKDSKTNENITEIDRLKKAKENLR